MVLPLTPPGVSLATKQMLPNAAAICHGFRYAQVMGFKYDLRGKRFGRLIAEYHIAQTIRSEWACICDCGRRKNIGSQALRLGLTQSCGCLNDEKRRTSKRTHGLTRVSRGVMRTEYQIWLGAKARCYRTTNLNYRHYGGRGITMCDRWVNDFGAFYADMGPRPSPFHSLDRKDNDGPYSPDNCRWATKQEQMSNTRRAWSVTHDGRTQTIAAWARELGLVFNTLRHRIVTGWPIDKALTSRKYDSRGR